MININPHIKGLEMRWQSDWNGYEVGYDDVPVVGYYTWKKFDFYIDMETNKILDIFFPQ